MDAAFKALAEPRRRAILRLVWSQELPATEIAEQFSDVSRPAISQHLSVLKEAELVNERRDGTRRLYSANTRTMAELRSFLDDYWTSGLERLRDVAEAAEAEQRSAASRRPTRAPATTRSKQDSSRRKGRTP
jgi:DNA-binding transcriptional ArsR family regulator